MMPGRAAFLPAITAAGNETGPRSLSIVSHLSENALWALIPAVVVFTATINLSRHQVMRLVYIVIGIAIFQSILGLMQFGGGPGSPLYFGSEYGGGSASGTYLNRDHLAGFLEMVFPVVLALLAATVGHKFGGGSRRRSRWRRRLDFLASMEGHRAFIYGTIATLLILALIFTKSRMGVAMAMVGLLLLLFAFSRRLGGNNAYGTYGTVVAVILVLAVEIGLAPVLDRFTQDPMEDLRWTIYSSSMEGVGDFFPLGSGSGTFPVVYPAYQPQDVHGYINRAHNDYLEYLFDGGIAAMVLIALVLSLILYNWRKIWIKGRWMEFRFVQVGAGIGVILLLLHSLVDFNLHKPANAVFFAFFLAVFMRENNQELLAKQRSQGRRAPTKRMPPKESVAAVPLKPKDIENSPLADW